VKTVEIYDCVANGGRRQWAEAEKERTSTRTRTPHFKKRVIFVVDNFHHTAIHCVKGRLATSVVQVLIRRSEKSEAVDISFEKHDMESTFRDGKSCK
jgi:hypothetical protein